MFHNISSSTLYGVTKLVTEVTKAVTLEESLTLKTRVHRSTRKERRVESKNCPGLPANIKDFFIVEIVWRNPFRVCSLVDSIPRVARASAFAGLRRDESQPWAGGRNPDGIEGPHTVRELAPAFVARRPGKDARSLNPRCLAAPSNRESPAVINALGIKSFIKQPRSGGFAIFFTLAIMKVVPRTESGSKLHALQTLREILCDHSSKHPRSRASNSCSSETRKNEPSSSCDPPSPPPLDGLAIFFILAMMSSRSLVSFVARSAFNE